MRQVSTVGEELFFHLIAWELCGQRDVEPKELLREASADDLQIIMANIADDRRAKEFLVAKMVEVEVLFREGLLQGDWSIEVFQDRADLSYTPSRPSSTALTLHLSGAIST